MPRSAAGWSRRCAAPDAPAAVRVEALYVAAHTASFLGDARAGVAYAEEGLALARSLATRCPRSRPLRGRLAWALSDDVARAVAYEEAVSLLRTTGVTSWEAMALAELGDTRLMTGDVAEAAVLLLDEALALHRRIESPVGIAVTLGERAHAARMQGDQCWPRASSPSIDGGGTWLERFLLGAVAGLAGVALALGQPERAVRVLGAVEATGLRVASAGSPMRPHRAHPHRAVRTSLPEPVFVAAWEEGRALSFADALADALALIGRRAATTRAP